jgi:uncharacterized membrane protein YtjA (UPF0391 family)
VSRESRISASSADFVPSLATIFAGSGSETARNFWFQPGLFLQPRRGCYRRADIETESQTEVLTMLSWVVTFLIIALIAGILGFGGIAGVSIEIAKTIFFIAVVLFLVSAVVGLARGRTRV